ncbi:hypothetical protein AWB74_08576 [Caballeronia arvi]|uniref:Uncharacterized protein n=1 Tax=Caballeronia arvi TaxID=1777135 RepID=A0A158L4Z8_9BURK|nr:hypothetical protein AWB74_08576 [Caballeronia arvi]
MPPAGNSRLAWHTRCCRIQADVADSIRTAAVHITTRLPRETPARFLRAEARSSMTVSDAFDVLLVVASKTVQPL